MRKLVFTPMLMNVIPVSPTSPTLLDWSTFIQKFGRRVQRMEDDGTVNMRKEPGRKGITNTEQQAKIASHRGTKEGFDSDGAAPAAVAEEEDLYYSNEENADDSSGDSTTSSSPNYGSLKQLLPKRPIWTKLDFRKFFFLRWIHYLVYILNTYVM